MRERGSERERGGDLGSEREGDDEGGCEGDKDMTHEDISPLPQPNPVGDPVCVCVCCPNQLGYRHSLCGHTQNTIY